MHGIKMPVPYRHIVVGYEQTCALRVFCESIGYVKVFGGAGKCVGGEGCIRKASYASLIYAWQGKLCMTYDHSTESVLVAAEDQRLFESAHSMTYGSFNSAIQQ